MDGYEATKAIRSNIAEFSNLPIIALTANATPKVIEKCLDSGMNDHLGKPFTPDELFIKLEKYLRHGSPIISSKKQLAPAKKQFATVDLSFLYKVSGNDPIFVKDVVDSFLRSTPTLVAAIKEGLSESNVRKMAQHIHKIKPSLTMIGLAKTKELGDYLEAELNSHELTDYLQQGILKFCSDVSGAIDELSAF
jgi:CheY-like chemotaxis protein